MSEILPMNQKQASGRYLLTLVIGALGVVYGDIGTSPLYALRECFHGTHAIDPSRDNVLGVLSLIFWCLFIIVSVKYLTFVMRANNRGEGGILALMSLAFPDREIRGRLQKVLIGIGVFGAALLYGDGMITPAISVLSAVEGLKVATPMFDNYVQLITIVIIIGLFSFQRAGTGRVGKTFGPITLIWFITIAILGIRGILIDPHVFVSINPWYGIKFFLSNGWAGFAVLGAVFLCVTGVEALYADMGHFGVKPIRKAWFSVVLPSLILNYLGQGALLLNSPQAVENPFYNLAPRWALYPLVGLAMMATVIASQALISGAFSLTMQAIQLGYLPRLDIKHTSAGEKGQIYIPQINWILMTACIALVLLFKTSGNLAGLYGVDISMTITITTILFFIVARHLWKWSLAKTLLLCGPLLAIELAFFGANLLKIPHGGWFPLLMATGIYTLMSTWKTGRILLRKKLQASSLPYNLFIDSISRNPPVRVKGTAVYMAGNPNGTPMALLHNLKHNKVLHERVVALTIVTDEVPHVDIEKRLEIEQLAEGLYRVIGHYGFMEEPHIPKLLKMCGENGLKVRSEDSSFFLSRETIIATHQPGMAIWRDRLFALMARNAGRVTTFFRIPPNRVVELGMQVEI
jgi:KUP system potassium uptake protein